MQVANYAANSLNQYTQIDVPGVADLMGIAHANAIVKVNGEAAARKGEYYQAELTFDNSAAILYPSITNQAVLSGTTNTTTGHVLIPKSPQTFWYDLDGNTLSDGVGTNTWDGENRTSSTEGAESVPTSARSKDAWHLDTSGYWVQRITHSWNGLAYVASSTNRFVWQANSLIALLPFEMEFQVLGGYVLSEREWIDNDGQVKMACYLLNRIETPETVLQGRRTHSPALYAWLCAGGNFSPAGFDLHLNGREQFQFNG